MSHALSDIEGRREARPGEHDRYFLFATKSPSGGEAFASSHTERRAECCLSRASTQGSIHFRSRPVRRCRSTAKLAGSLGECRAAVDGATESTHCKARAGAAVASCVPVAGGMLPDNIRWRRGRFSGGRLGKRPPPSGAWVNAFAFGRVDGNRTRYTWVFSPVL